MPGMLRAVFMQRSALYRLTAMGDIVCAVGLKNKTGHAILNLHKTEYKKMLSVCPASGNRQKRVGKED